jgi:hypothetical protein
MELFLTYSFFALAFAISLKVLILSISRAQKRKAQVKTFYIANYSLLLPLILVILV